MLELGVIEPSVSKWASPPIPVKKKDGGIRIVIDFRKLNQVTVSEPFTMPSIDEILSHLGNATILLKMDLLKGFYKVPMEESSNNTRLLPAYRENSSFVLCPSG